MGLLALSMDRRAAVVVGGTLLLTAVATFLSLPSLRCRLPLESSVSMRHVEGPLGPLEVWPSRRSVAWLSAERVFAHCLSIMQSSEFGMNFGSDPGVCGRLCRLAGKDVSPCDRA